MNSDSELLLKYQGFVIEVMPVINMLEDQEKEILKQVNFFNKRGKYKEIEGKYSKFIEMLFAFWQTIYDNENQFYDTLRFKNQSILEQGKSVYANTEISRLVEQFFFSLFLRTSYLCRGYKGNIKLNDGYDLSNKKTMYMLKVMNTINTKYLNSVLPLYPIDE